MECLPERQCHRRPSGTMFTPGRSVRAWPFLLRASPRPTVMYSLSVSRSLKHVRVHHESAPHADGQSPQGLQGTVARVAARGVSNESLRSGNSGGDPASGCGDGAHYSAHKMNLARAK